MESFYFKSFVSVVDSTRSRKSLELLPSPPSPRKLTDFSITRILGLENDEAHNETICSGKWQLNFSLCITGYDVNITKLTYKWHLNRQTFSLVYYCNAWWLKYNLKVASRIIWTWKLTLHNLFSLTQFCSAHCYDGENDCHFSKKRSNNISGAREPTFSVKFVCSVRKKTCFYRSRLLLVFIYCF